MLKILNLPSWAVSFMTHEQAMQTIIQPRFQHAFLKRMSEKIEAVVGWPEVVAPTMPDTD